MFFGGALQTLATILWWLTDLYTRFVLGQPVAWTVAPGAAHAYLMIYGLFPFFIFGFLMTVFPRWMAGKEISASRYTPAFVLLMLGAILFYIGLASSKIALAASVLLTLCGWAIACHALLRVLLDTAQQNKRHPIAAAIALMLGWCGILSYLVWLLGGQGMWLNFALQAGVWLLLLPVFATVGHRMIPFFTSSALLQNNTISRAEWPWWIILAGSTAHGMLQLNDAYAWLWLCDAPLAIASLYLSWRWNLCHSFAIPMVAVLHVGFAWLGVAALLFTAQSLILFLSDGAYIMFGLAPLHALGMGCFSTLLLCMATRVTLGHSGKPVTPGRSVYLLFAAFQIVVLLRVLADILPASWRAGLYVTAATAWLACFLPWVITYLPIYLKPRSDGRPG
jgi:uncharacterized protein involved in response to NO